MRRPGVRVPSAPLLPEGPTVSRGPFSLPGWPRSRPSRRFALSVDLGDDSAAAPEPLRAWTVHTVPSSCHNVVAGRSNALEWPTHPWSCPVSWVRVTRTPALRLVTTSRSRSAIFHEPLPPTCGPDILRANCAATGDRISAHGEHRSAAPRESWHGTELKNCFPDHCVRFRALCWGPARCSGTGGRGEYQGECGWNRHR